MQRKGRGQEAPPFPGAKMLFPTKSKIVKHKIFT